MEQLRYERKFLIVDYSFADVEQIIKFHPSRFTEIFHQRNVNNIYFDTLGMNAYYDNVEGEKNRTKVRIRWYGDTFGIINHPVLEYKIKQGLLGNKNSYSLNSFVLDSNFSKEQILKAVDNSNIPISVKNELLSLKPTLLNSYTRKYFLSADKKNRLTIDHNLTYYKITYYNNTFLNKVIDNKATVLELKYENEHELEAKQICNSFPFMLTKNSKYLQGLESVFM